MDVVDALDLQIMELLSVDGRMSSAEMARRLGHPVRTVRFRLERLRTHDILQVCPVLNPAAFGYTILADVLIATEAGRFQEIAEALALLPQVTYVACATGDHDVSIQVVARSVDELYAFIADELHALPGVQRTQTVLLLEKLKDVHQWHPLRPPAG